MSEPPAIAGDGTAIARLVRGDLMSLELDDGRNAAALQAWDGRDSAKALYEQVLGLALQLRKLIREGDTTAAASERIANLVHENQRLSDVVGEQRRIIRALERRLGIQRGPQHRPEPTTPPPGRGGVPSRSAM